VSPDWRELVYQTDRRGKQRVARMVYEVCTFQALRDQLRCKEIWVVGADKWRNPAEDLPTDFEQRGSSLSDEPSCLEYAQMPGDRRTTDRKPRGNITRGQLAGAEVLQDLPARRVGQRAEHTGFLFRVDLGHV
jgi:hypothetical protein